MSLAHAVRGVEDPPPWSSDENSETGRLLWRRKRVSFRTADHPRDNGKAARASRDLIQKTAIFSHGNLVFRALNAVIHCAV